MSRDRPRSLWALFVIAVIILSYLQIFSSSFPVAHAADSLSWFNSRLPLGIDASFVDVNLTNFPTLVYLDSTDIDWSDVQDDLDDIRFVWHDNTTFLDYGIEDYDVNDKAWFWVSLPEIDSASTTLFWIYYGNTTISSGENSDAVWDASEYVAVYLMADENSTAILDSTANNNDGTKKGVGEPVEIDGMVGRAQTFDGTDDYINCGPLDQNFTQMSGFILLRGSHPPVFEDTWVVYQDYWEQGTPDIGDWSLGLDHSANNGVVWPRLKSNSGAIDQEPVTLPWDEWGGVGWNWNTTRVNYYRNGTDIGASDNMQPSNWFSPDADLWLGGAIYMIGDDLNFTGSIDMLVVSNVSRPASWHKAMYANANSEDAFSFVYNAPPDVENAFITNMDYGDWVITNTKYYQFVGNYSDGTGYEDIEIAKIAFTDGYTWVNATYNKTADTWTLDSGTGYVYLADGVATGTGTVLNVTFPIYFTTSIRGALDVDLYLYVEDSTGSSDGWTLTDADYFNIYSVEVGGGGQTEDTTTGDGYRVIGGTPFDLAVQNGTAGSSARVNMYVVNFQHINTLTHLWQGATWDTSPGYWDCITEHNETGYLEYGVDYYLDGAWVEGWKVQLEITNGSAGTFGAGADEAYVIINASWYNRGSLIKSDTLVVMYEAYKPSDLTTQFTLWVDLWISNLEGSSMVAGHVSAQYYGMSETGWWLWADWGPVHGTLTSTTFMDDLQDASDNTITANSLYMFRVWTKLAKTGEGGGPTDCDNHWWTSNHEIGPNIRTLPPTENLTGIMTPTIQPTTTPDMPIGYFPSLASALVEVLLRIETVLVSSGTYIYSMATDTIDSVFDAGLGIPSFTGLIGGLASSFGAYVSDSVGYVMSLITMIFGLFSSIAAFIITWMGNFISMILQIAAIVQGILDGTYAITTGLGNIWDLIDVDEWADAIPLFMVLGWFTSIDSRARRSGSWMGIFWGDVSMMMAVFSFIFDMSMRVISLIIDWAARFATFILPL